MRAQADAQAFLGWWEEDYSWDGLKNKLCSTGTGEYLVDHWASEEGDLRDCGGKKWTRYHLPMHDCDGNPSEKAYWSERERAQFMSDLQSLLLVPLRALESGSASRSSEPRFDVDLSGIVVPGPLELADLRDRRVDLRASIVHGPVKIANSSFPSIRLARAIFGDVFHVADVTISGTAYLKGATFVGEAHFGPNLEIGGDLYLRSVNFRRRCFFWGLRALAGVSLWKATLDDDGHFVACDFGGYTVFRNTVFNGEVHFSGAQPTTPQPLIAPDRDFEYRPCTFCQKLDMSADGDIAFGSFVSFRGVHFKHDANFSGRRFAGRASFRLARFDGAPVFHDCDLPVAIDFNGTEFNGSAPPDVRGDERNEIEGNLELSYRTLRRAARDEGDIDRELRFATEEFGARLRRSDIPRAERFAIHAFRLLSKYNGSLSRPVIGWVVGAIALTGGAWFVAAASGLMQGHHWPDYLHLTRVTWTRFLPPPGGWLTEDLRALTKATGLSATFFRAFAAVQIVWTASMFTLFILALRRRFAIATS